MERKSKMKLLKILKWLNKNELKFSHKSAQLRIVGFIFLLTCFNCCDANKYAEGVIKDTKLIFSKNKKFMYDIRFNAIIIDKELCSVCDINKYSIKLKIEDISEKPSLSNSQYSPYYNFEGDTILIISVTKDLYEDLDLKQRLLKNAHSYDLLEDSKKHPFLNKKDYKWLP